jgi:hypothetical protein
VATEHVCAAPLRPASRGRAALWLLLAGLLALLPQWARAADPVEVTVSEPYMELRTGPGRGYPVYYVAERGEVVQVLKRRTDWFKVRTERKREGWVSREQMERTLMAEGVSQQLRDAVLEDFRHKRFELGGSAGLFKGDPVVSAQFGYLVTDNLITELNIQQIAGTYSGSFIISGHLVLQPGTDSRFVPFFSLGGGMFQNRNRGTLVGTTSAVDSTEADAGIGLRVYLARNFLLRLDYRQYIVLTSVQKNDRFDEELIGLSFFF